MSYSYNPIWRYRKLRAQLRRLNRRLFVSSAEVNMAALLGCKTYTFNFLRSPRPPHFPLSVIVPKGWYKDNYIEREVRIGRGKQQRSIDFANRRMRRGIEVDGRNYHDVVADFEKDEAAAKLGWRIERIPAAWLNPRSREYNPRRVANRVNKLFE